MNNYYNSDVYLARLAAREARMNLHKTNVNEMSVQELVIAVHAITNSVTQREIRKRYSAQELRRVLLTYRSNTYKKGIETNVPKKINRGVA